MAHQDGVRRAQPFIVVSYTPDQAGQPIRDEDIIRADNGMFFTQDEIAHFRDRSRMTCPTYGTCTGCWKAGPVGKRCNDCDDDNVGFKVVFIGVGIGRIVDSEFIARFFNKGIEQALADRLDICIRTPSQEKQRSDFHDEIHRKHSGLCGQELTNAIQSDFTIIDHVLFGRP